MKPAAAYPTLVQHQGAPRHLARLHTPNLRISHYLSGGLRIPSLFSPPMLLSLPTRSPSQHMPFLAHISHNRIAMLSTTSTPPLLTTANAMVAHVLSSDPVITEEWLSTPTRHFGWLPPGQFVLHPPSDHIVRWPELYACRQHYHHARPHPQCPAVCHTTAGFFFIDISHIFR